MAEKQTSESTYTYENKKFSQMDGRQKLLYFRDYYLIKVLIALAIIIGVCWYIHDVRQNKKIIYAGAGVGVNLSESGSDYLSDGFIDYLGKDYSRKKASYGGNVLLVPQSGEYNENSVEMAFLSQIKSGMFQYLLMTKKQYEHYLQYNFYLDLSEMLTDSKYESFEKLENEQGKPMAILLPENVLEKFGLEGKSIYLCFVYSEEPNELHSKMLEYLYS